MEIAISKAQRILPRLIRLAREGEIVILTKGRRRVPVATIEVLDAASSTAAAAPQWPLKDGERPIGLYKNEMEDAVKRAKLASSAEPSL